MVVIETNFLKVLEISAQAGEKETRVFVFVERMEISGLHKTKKNRKLPAKTVLWSLSLSRSNLSDLSYILKVWKTNEIQCIKGQKQKKKTRNQIVKYRLPVSFSSSAKKNEMIIKQKNFYRKFGANDLPSITFSWSRAPWPSVSLAAQKMESLTEKKQ